MPDTIKSLIDGLDKVTDILNIGRLLFYTTAGFCAVLPVSMCLLLLGQETITHVYWSQFVSDLLKSTRHYAVWLAGLIFGFVISVLANADVKKPPEEKVDQDLYSYQYPRLYSGGIRLKEGTSKDYAAWLISEYYRYYEIALFIPYGLMLSLPVYALYSLTYLIRMAVKPGSFTLGAEYFAFPTWSFVAVFVWTIFWPLYWVPNVVQKSLEDWVRAKRNTVQGLEDFIKETQPAPQQSGSVQTPK